MRRGAVSPALVAHGGAGGRTPPADREARRRGMLAAIERGAAILRGGGSALDAVVAAVMVLEDDPLFNAGYGSLLTTEGRVEMDAAVMTARRRESSPTGSDGTQPRREVAAAQHGRTRAVEIGAGGVVLVSRVRNPIALARVVMERTPHLLVGGAGAERIARENGIRLCRPADLVSQRARERWVTAHGQVHSAEPAVARGRHGTVGAVAVDARGDIAAATSTGGVPGKLPGRIGDSAIVGAGLFAAARGGAAATGAGEAIMRTALCREAVSSLARLTVQEAAARAIAMLAEATGAQAGVIMANGAGRIGYAHNAEAMETAMFDASGVHHLLPEAVNFRGDHRSQCRGR